MPFSPHTMRMILFGCALSMILLAAFYLRRRKLPPLAYAAWGLFALMIPFIGPFLVIWIRPGEFRTA